MAKTSNNVVKEGREYARGVFSIFTEERVNGWGFRIRSVKYFMIYCMGGFEAQDMALWHASKFIDFLEAGEEAGLAGMKVKNLDVGVPQALPTRQEAPAKASRKRAIARR